MARKICSVCGVRPVGGGKSSGYEDTTYARQHGYCYPCADQGQMSNSHHNGHESIPEEECWYCHPELDETKKEYVVREGTSRAGMMITVPIRAHALDKAATVIETITGQKVEGDTIRKVQASAKTAGATIKVTGKGLLTTLTLGTIELNWDDRGRFLSGTFEGRKVRNVSDLLRRLAEAGTEA